MNIRAAGRTPPIRILAGRWKGRRLDVPAGARPTSGRARASLFDLLGPARVAGARVLDVYAGSGAVGIEAVSRGARAAVLVEADPGAIGRTLARLGDPAGQVRLEAGSAASAIASLARAGARFDLIFADPPYGRGPGADLDRIAEILGPAGTLVLQTDAAAAPLPPPGTREVRSRAYGRNVFHFFEIL